MSIKDVWKSIDKKEFIKELFIACAGITTIYYIFYIIAALKY